MCFKIVGNCKPRLVFVCLVELNDLCSKYNHSSRKFSLNFWVSSLTLSSSSNVLRGITVQLCSDAQNTFVGLMYDRLWSTALIQNPLQSLRVENFDSFIDFGDCCGELFLALVKELSTHFCSDYNFDIKTVYKLIFVE